MDTGIRSVLVKPGGKRDVVVTIKGLHPNTKDSTVLSYLTKFGTIPQAKVVYGFFGDGPLKGMRNGDRQYKVEIKPGNNIGSYHLIDGVRVSLRYVGQQQTCGRCQRVASSCKGGGIAKRCESQGGEKVDFKNFTEKLWKDIGYNPESDQEYSCEADNNVELAEHFTPPKVQSFPLEKFTGVSIKRFPKDVDNGDILEFLITHGLPEDKKEVVEFSNNGSVIIKELDNYIVEYLMQSIHGKMIFGRKLYCNGLVTLTPEKNDKIDEGCKLPVVLQPGIDNSSSASLTGQEKSADESIEKLVRRHSLSLMNRTPDKNSLAADLLSSPRVDFGKTSSLINELKEQLSDFASCIDTSNDEKDDEFTKVDEKKRHRKRKTRDSPSKDGFLKKPNLVQK